MKHLLLAVAVLFASAGLMAQNTMFNAQTSAPDSTHILVAYFSATGRTEALANEIAVLTGGRLWQIEPMEPYTEQDLDYRNPESRSSKEYKKQDERPTIKMCTDLRPYDVIFIGYPIWWNEAPRIIMSWFDNNILEGKTIIPFATSGGSGIENSVTVLRRVYPDVKILDGICFTKSDLPRLKHFLKDYLK